MKNKLIYIVPGFLTNPHSSGFSDLETFDSETYDIKIHDAFVSLSPKTSVHSLVEDFEKNIKVLALKYPELFIIAHSAGAELVLRADLPEAVKAVAFWSPSMFRPSRVTETLPPSKDNPDILLFNGTVPIQRTLAMEIDSLNTAELVSNMQKPHIVFLSEEDLGKEVWPSYIPIPYGHNYSATELRNMLASTISKIEKL